MTTSSTGAPAPAAAVAACKHLFDLHPEDLIGVIHHAVEVLGWLEEIFGAISREAKSEHNPRLRALADAGAWLAMDNANLTDHQYQTLRQHLIAAGIQLVSQEN